MADELRGADAFIDQLVAADVRVVFGNPGTTEQPFLGRLARYPEIEFITALHEGVAVVAAEGYARAGRTLGVVQLHAGPGLGNGLGMLYNAAEGRTPLLVYVGEVEQRGQYSEPTLGGDLVSLAAPVAKWAYELRTADEIPQVLRRAIKVATTPPCGPVVIAAPMDLMEAPCAGLVVSPDQVLTEVRPDPAAVANAAAVIARADAPVILAGDGVVAAGAIRELSELGRLIGAPIYGAFMHEACIDPDEPLNAGRLPSIDGAQAARTLENYDAVVAVGTKLFAHIFPVPGLPLGERDVVHVGLDPWELAKNQPSTVVFGDERAAVRDLIDALKDRLAPRADDVQQRRARAESDIAAARQRARDADRGSWDSVPMTPERAVAELAAVMPDNACLVDESLTAYGAVSRYFRISPGRWFRLRGGGIGAGMPMPIGVQLARPDEKVVAVVGDGSALYSITALWTAAHHRLPIVWAILNNHSYRILKENARRDGATFERTGNPAGVDLVDPEMDFVSLAEGFGVRAHRVERPEELHESFTAALAADHPVLIDIAVSGSRTEG